jgi:predicted dehydrogenase
MLNAASVGLGWWSDELAGAIQGKSELVRVASCFSRTPEKREAFAGKFATAQHESYEAVLADPAIDAVILTTPHSLHAEHVIAAARAGKHVFVEKPFTLTAESGRIAAAACEAAGVVLAVGHNRRFSAASRALKDMLEAGELGTLLHMETNFSAPGGLAYTTDRWRASRTESPAGGLAGLGVHMIDLAVWLGGRVRRVNAQSVRRAVPVDIDDTTSALFALESGATASLVTLMACPYTIFVNVYGTKANAFAAIDANRLEVQLPGEQPQPRALQPVETLKAELEEFALACAGRVTYRIRPQEAIHTVAVMEAITRSAAEGGAPVTPDGA